MIRLMHTAGNSTNSERSRKRSSKWSARICGAALLVLVLTGLAACGGNEAGSSTSTAGKEENPVSATQAKLFDPCKLFSQETAARVLAAKVTVSPDLTAPICRYISQETKQGAGNVPTRPAVIVSIGQSDDAKTYLSFDSGSTNLQHVSGVGDDALFIPLAVGAALVTRQGSIVSSITIIDPTAKKDGLQKSLKDLATETAQTLASGSATINGTATHPCEMVTAQEASQELQNKPVHWLWSANAAGVASCDYLSSLGALKRITVVVNEQESGSKKLYDQRLAVFAKKKVLSGIADEAFFDGSNTVWAWKQHAFFHVTVMGASDSAQVGKRLALLASKRF